jgi:lambda repressor-like predicted transcriptional regulator
MIDGIADALGVDDSTFEIHWPPRFAESVHKGQIIVELRVAS